VAFILWPLDHPRPAARAMATARDPGRPSGGPPDDRRRRRCVLQPPASCRATPPGKLEMAPCTPKKEGKKMGAVHHVAVYVYGSGWDVSFVKLRSTVSGAHGTVLLCCSMNILCSMEKNKIKGT